VLILALVKGKCYSHVIVAARVATCIEQQTRVPAYELGQQGGTS